LRSFGGSGIFWSNAMNLDEIKALHKAEAKALAELFGCQRP
jgi:hypothetical protein